jgi:hypothetical protein
VKNDVEMLLHEEVSLRSGEFGLWLKIFSLSFFELKEGRFSGTAAKEFLFDSENIFFDYLAGALGYEAVDLRKRLLKALERPGRET